MAGQAHERRRTAVLDELRRAGGKALSVRELMQRAKLHPGERTDVKRALRDLAREGVLHRDGYGFVARLDRKGDDVFVPPDEAARAVDGDLVRVEIVPARGGRTMGRLVEVVERRRRLLIGTYQARGPQSFVVPSSTVTSEERRTT